LTLFKNEVVYGVLGADVSFLKSAFSIKTARGLPGKIFAKTGVDDSCAPFDYTYS